MAVFYNENTNIKLRLQYLMTEKVLLVYLNDNIISNETWLYKQKHARNEYIYIYEVDTISRSYKQE